MLDADSVFERLLREAANLVPKMSTPKLTAALKASSGLQQRITDTLSTRLNHEQFSLSCATYRQMPQIARAPNFCEDMMSENLSLTKNENNFTNCTVSASNYGGIPFLSHFNQFALNPRTATLVTITNPHGTNLTGTAVVGALSPGAAMISHADRGQDPSLNSVSKVSLVPIGAMPSIQCIGSTEMIENGGLLAQHDTREMKPESVSCLTRCSTTSCTVPGESLFTSPISTDLSTLGFVPLSSVADCQLCTISNIASSNAITVSSSIATNKSSSGYPNNNSNNNSCTSSPAGTTLCKSGPYVCRDCGKEFRILRYLEKHRRIHTGEKPYQCCYCGRQFNDWPNMNRHKRIHTGERPYRCAVCTKTFSQPAVYNEHVKRHTGERPYICSVCSKGFPRAARLAVHMRVHTGERPYLCTVCDRRFSQPHHLSAHLRVHSGDRPFVCPKCEVSFACISNLRRHRKQVHPPSPTVVSSIPSHPAISLESKYQLHSTSDSLSQSLSILPTTAVSLAHNGLMSGLHFTSSHNLPTHQDPVGVGGIGLLPLSGPTTTTSNTSNANLTIIPSITQQSGLMSINDSSSDLLQSVQTQSRPSSVSDAMMFTQTGNMINITSTSDEEFISSSQQQKNCRLHHNMSTAMLELLPASGDSTNCLMFDSSHTQEQPSDGSIFLNSISHSNTDELASFVNGISSSPLECASSLISSSSSSLPQIQIQQLGGIPFGHIAFTSALGPKQHFLCNSSVLIPDSHCDPSLDCSISPNAVAPFRICYSKATNGRPDQGATIILQGGQMFAGSGLIGSQQSCISLDDGQTLNAFPAGQFISSHGQSALLVPIGSPQLSSVSASARFMQLPPSTKVPMLTSPPSPMRLTPTSSSLWITDAVNDGSHPTGLSSNFSNVSNNHSRSITPNHLTSCSNPNTSSSADSNSVG